MSIFSFRQNETIWEKCLVLIKCHLVPAILGMQWQSLCHSLFSQMRLQVLPASVKQLEFSRQTSQFNEKELRQCVRTWTCFFFSWFWEHSSRKKVPVSLEFVSIKVILIKKVHLDRKIFQPAQQLPVHQREEMLPTKPEGRLEKQPWTLYPGVQPMMQPKLHRMSQLPPSSIIGNLEFRQKRCASVMGY